MTTPTQNNPVHPARTGSDLTALHISAAVKEAEFKIIERRQGIDTGLKTRWLRLNGYIGGGLQWASNYLIASITGGGKSAIANIVESDLIDLNPKEKIIVLDFNMEMPSYRQVLRKISSRVNIPVNTLLSAAEPLEERILDSLISHYEKIKDYPFIILTQQEQ